MSASTEAEIEQRIDTIEAAYEYMLAYAAKGVVGNEPGGPAGEIRRELTSSEQALDGLAGLFRTVVEARGLQSADDYRAFIDVLERDAGAARAAIRLVLAQQTISSQIVDNLNALIHLRALLTDLFVIDEVLKPYAGSAAG